MSIRSDSGNAMCDFVKRSWLLEQFLSVSIMLEMSFETSHMSLGLLQVVSMSDNNEWCSG